jgi:hypothetical protein
VVVVVVVVLVLLSLSSPPYPSPAALQAFAAPLFNQFRAMTITNASCCYLYLLLLIVPLLWLKVLHMTTSCCSNTTHGTKLPHLLLLLLLVPVLWI